MHTGSTSGEDLRDFERFLERREEAARAFVSGEAAPLGRIVARVLPATFFGPQGGYEKAQITSTRYMNATPHASFPATVASRFCR